MCLVAATHEAANRPGSRFIADISLIFRMERPDAKMRKPPTIDISHMSPQVGSGERKVANKKMEPCQQKSTPAAMAMPNPNVEASTMEVTRSSMALVNRNASSPYSAELMGPKMDSVPMQNSMMAVERPRPRLGVSSPPLSFERLSTSLLNRPSRLSAVPITPPSARLAMKSTG